MDNILQNLIRLGRVSSINAAEATVRVVFEDRDNMVSHDLPVVVANTFKNKDYYMPDIGESVVCIFLPNGISRGFVLGAVYSDVDRPAVSSPDKRQIHFSDGAVVEYDRQTRTMTVNTSGKVSITAAQGINITGNVSVNGDISVNGNIQAGGSIIDSGGNTNHHSH
jgi:phage baseplate assembly protein V